MFLRGYSTGATGYIGGDFLHAITKAHPELAITALVRQQSAAKRLKDLYPGVDIIEGDLDDSDLLFRAGVESDVVLSLYHLCPFHEQPLKFCRSRGHEPPSQLEGFPQRIV